MYVAQSDNKILFCQIYGDLNDTKYEQGWNCSSYKQTPIEAYHAQQNKVIC